MLSKVIDLFWILFKLNILFIIGNAVLIFSAVAVPPNIITIPIYIVGLLGFGVSLQALFSTIKQQEKLAEIHLLYIQCCKEGFKNTIRFVTGHLLGAMVLLGAYIGTAFAPWLTLFVPLYSVLGILLYVHFVFCLIIRSHYVIDIKNTYKLGIYCISGHPITTLFIFGGTLIMVGFIAIFPYSIILGIIPFAVYLLLNYTKKIFDGIELHR